MAFTHSPFTSQPTPSDLDRKLYPSDLFDDSLDSETSLVDGAFSPTSTDRKDSFATTSTAIFSPQSTVSNWDDFPVPNSGPVSERHLAMGNQFTETPMRGNPFLQHIQQHQQQQWFKSTIGPGTFDSYPDAFDGSSNLGNYPQQTNFSGLSGHMDNVRPAAIMPPSAGASQAMSAASPMAFVEQELESHRLTKRMRPGSPQRGSASYVRQDGVRKKNARFEIPMERNLQNIDELIAKASNEDDKKELKQQKRLLRNRQAALDSRQRKKKHTEDLEEEKKAWTDRNSSLEMDNKDMQMRMEALTLEFQNMRATAQNLEIQVQALRNEKEDLVLKHTLETSELRQKITILRDQLESSPQSAPSHPSDYTDFATELENLNMGPEGDWSNWVTDYAEVETAQEDSSKSSVVETTLVVGQPRKDTLMSDMTEEKPSVAGKVLQLFTLVGALIAARPTTAPPTMSREYQAEGQAIVEHVLNSNPGLQQASMAMLPGSNIQWPQPSVTSQGQAVIAPVFSPAANPAASTPLSRRVLGQTKQQMAEAAFSMTPAQYHSMTNADFSRRSYEDHHQDDMTGRNGPMMRKSLSDLVRADREATQENGHMAEVYSRSLMWDRIPADVVQEFKKMVTGFPGDEGDGKVDYDD